MIRMWEGRQCDIMRQRFASFEGAGKGLTRGHSFVKGALILTAAGLSVRLLGAGLRIFLAAVMGDEGIGLYQMAYPIYTTLLAVSTAGIPIAVSKLVAENLAQGDYRGGYRVFKTAFLILTLLGAFFSLVLYFGADFFVQNIVKDPRAFYPLVSISPAIFLVTIVSAFRGFFQGQHEMKPTAISQVVEQLGRIAVVVLLVFLLLPLGLEFAAAGATFGAVAGAVFALAVLLIIYIRNRRSFEMQLQRQRVMREFSTGQVLYRIFALSLPITMGSLVIPLTNLVDLSVVPMRLHEAGFSTTEATSLYGQLTGMANSVIQFPIILTIALAMSLVPAISEAQTLQNAVLIRRRTDMALRITHIFSIPAALGLFVLAEPTTLVLFDNAPAAYPLSVLSFGIIFLSLYTSTSGILQGLGHPMEPVKHMLLGALLKFGLSWFLTAIPALHIGGAAFSTVAGFLLASSLNLRRVSYYTGWRYNVKDHLLKPLLAALPMALAVNLLVSITWFEGLFSVRLAQAASLAAAVVLGMVVYALALFLVKGVYQEDLQSIPRVGPWLVRVARRFKLFSE